MSRQVFGLDLVNDEVLISAYEARHAAGAVWPQVIRDLRERGFFELEIWRVANRMVMIAEVAEDFPRVSDPTLAPVVDRWENEMEVAQRRIQEDGPKWAPMQRIFSLAEQE